jgi:hypothetical protein
MLLLPVISFESMDLFIRYEATRLRPRCWRVTASTIS